MTIMFKPSFSNNDHRRIQAAPPIISAQFNFHENFGWKSCKTQDLTLPPSPASWKSQTRYWLSIFPETVFRLAHWFWSSVSATNRLLYTTIGVGDWFSRYNFDRSRFTTCAYVTRRIQQGERRKFVCTEPVWGRYVAVFHKTSRKEHLAICELEVYVASTCSE